MSPTPIGCFQWFKDTNSKANHNQKDSTVNILDVVFNGSKILIRKQITTFPKVGAQATWLFSMVQRY